MTELDARVSGTSAGHPRDFRSPAERDRARIVHSSSFRRLQKKTQVLGITEGDYHRTRLTHSMEVAQIAVGILRMIRRGSPGAAIPEELTPSTDLIESICFAHDLGHPPFGHGGEIALNYAMRDAGGFEGNGQTLRMLMRLESHTENHGLDLSRRTLLGVLKYPVPYSRVVRKNPPKPAVDPRHLKSSTWKPPKCYLDSEVDQVAWLLEAFTKRDRDEFTKLAKSPGKTIHGRAASKTFDCSLMEIADDISYGVHDLEDSIALRLLTPEAFTRVEDTYDLTWARQFKLGGFKKLSNDLFGAEGYLRKRAIGSLINALINSVNIVEDPAFQNPLLRYRAVLHEPARPFLKALTDLVFELVIRSHAVQTIEYRGQILIVELFDALASDPVRLLPPDYAAMYQAGAADSDKAGRRAICDYIAGMTDAYAERLYNRLFTPGAGTVFERL